ncbi:proteasome regulatory subunit domain containing protein [Nitzschia inconspicua]|uniref:Proteasome regulatory subunit domain containing protein n=1 Tax=Nitzschia inconspicua TaxID=303405 RepID=A0A9K3LJV5_9STRA|nr:proteasome regulatory subunit domain containing protein [Nitzschia inconspicua]
MEDSSKTNEEQKKDTATTTMALPTPPLEVAARRLERLLGGGLSEKDRHLYTYTNPTKVVRRWLGSASGAAGKASSADIASAATVLLDPDNVCGPGRALLLQVCDDPATTATGDSNVAMDVDESTDGTDDQKNRDEERGKYLSLVSSREVESWLLSLQVRLLWKEEKYTEAMTLVEKGIATVLNHLDVASQKMTSAAGVSMSSLFPLLARLYRYRSLVADAVKDPNIALYLRGEMSKAHNMACLRRDFESQATLLNLMLRDLLQHSQIEQAHKLLSNANFPESASNNELCRYLYYSGRIQALRLEYTKAFSNLSQCLRKAPTNTGLGFRITAQRLLVVVQLLMGEIPDRGTFFAKGMKTELAPYLAITQAVRRGDLAVFTQVVSEQATRLQQDETYTLISRLAHQVVKAGLRKLHVSYSRLSLQDVADRLGLPSATSAEFVVAKAVRDGVLDATIHHEDGYVQSHDLVDVYATKEPAEAFHRRIAYCLTTHNDAVRGMRYPPDAYKKQLEASRGNRRGKKSDDKTDEEKAQELEDEMEEDY